MFGFQYNEIDFAHKLDRASEPTEDYSKHLHYFNEILYFIEGDVQYTVESETRKLCPGDLVFIGAGKYHFATVNSEVAYERYVLKFHDTVLPQHLASRIKDLSPFFGSIKKYNIIFDELDSYYGNYSDDDLYSLFTCAVTKLLIMLSKETAYSNIQVNGLVAKIIRYVDENIRGEITLESLSAAFNFSKSYISNEFKRYMKIPIMKYVRAKKIIAAHQLVLGGEKKSKVAEMFGFENYSTFYRQYQKIYKGEL